MICTDWVKGWKETSAPHSYQADSRGGPVASALVLRVGGGAGRDS